LIGELRDRTKARCLHVCFFANFGQKRQVGTEKRALFFLLCK
jgi:hypothetical protein